MKTLLIKNVDVEDAGMYVCKLERTQEELTFRVEKDYIERNTLLQIQMNGNIRTADSQTYHDYKNRLSFDYFLRNKTSEEGLNTTLSCCVRGKNPIVVWYRNGVELTDSSRYRSTNDDGFINLEILEVKYEDSGEYECKVRNDLNEITSKCFLNVYEKVQSTRPVVASPTYEDHEGI